MRPPDIFVVHPADLAMIPYVRHSASGFIKYSLQPIPALQKYPSHVIYRHSWMYLRRFTARFLRTIHPLNFVCYITDLRSRPICRAYLFVIMSPIIPPVSPEFSLNYTTQDLYSDSKLRQFVLSQAIDVPRETVRLRLHISRHIPQLVLQYSQLLTHAICTMPTASLSLPRKKKLRLHVYLLILEYSQAVTYAIECLIKRLCLEQFLLPDSFLQQSQSVILAIERLVNGLRSFQHFLLPDPSNALTAMRKRRKITHVFGSTRAQQ